MTFGDLEIPLGSGGVVLTASGALPSIATHQPKSRGLVAILKLFFGGGHELTVYSAFQETKLFLCSSDSAESVASARAQRPTSVRWLGESWNYHLYLSSISSSLFITEIVEPTQVSKAAL